MHVLDQRLALSRKSPLALFGGLFLAGLVFTMMALVQLNMRYTPAEPEPALAEFHLPPPPPPPVQKTPPKKTAVSINFNIPSVPGPADVPLGFLNVDFGLNPKELSQTNINVDDTIETYQTDGLKDLTIYDYSDVTEKPRQTYSPLLRLESRQISKTKKPFSFIIIVRITKRGRCSDVHIVDCPYPDAIPTIEEWVRGTTYRPARKNGQPVDCLMRRRITFRPRTGSPFSP